VEARTSQASLGSMAVAKRARGAGPGAQGGWVVVTVGVAERKVGVGGRMWCDAVNGLVGC
jgi:hypothetical protein